jgi:TetR/AcrR family transcriptional regulator, transcriptional repressor for nem operon
MRYPAAETAERHTRILEQAARLFRERGFSGVSVSEIMKATGLTHGPFYNHFASKEALVAESLQHASEKALAEMTLAQQSPEQMVAYVRQYVSEAHRDAPSEGCLLPAFGSEIGREPTAQAGFTAHLTGMITRLTASFPWPRKRSARGDSIRMLSAMVGAVMLARAVDDAALSDEILREVRSGLE